MKRRISRVAASAVVAAVTPLLLVGSALAADPTVTADVFSSPGGAVSPGAAILFVANVQYHGRSRINFVTATSSAPSATFINSWVDGAACGSETCSLGSFPGGGTSAALWFLYRAPASGTIPWSVTVSLGEGGTDAEGAAHTDTFPFALPPVDVEQNLDTGLGMLLPDNVFDGASTVTSGLALNAANAHGTQLTFPGASAQGTLATIRDVAGVPCPASFKNRDQCFGAASELSVLDGALVTPYLKVIVGFGAAEVPKGVKARNVDLLHVLDDGSWRVIAKTCASGNPAPAELPCRGTATTDAAGTILVPVWLEHNGLIRGW